MPQHNHNAEEDNAEGHMLHQIMDREEMVDITKASFEFFVPKKSWR
jgi:hypothetical protein